MASSHTTNSEVSESPCGNKHFLLLAIGNELDLIVGEPPGYGDGRTSLVFGLKADPEVGEPPGNDQPPPYPNYGLYTAPSSGFGWRSNSGA